MKNFIKTISFMVVTVLLLSSILPVSIYATSLTNGGETDSSVVGAKTGPEDVTIQVTNEQALYSSVTDKMKIPIKIDAYNSSYIKNASITFENSNFSIDGSEIVNSKNIQSVYNDEIKLNSSEIDDKIELTIPVSFKKLDYVPEDYFNRNVTIKLTGTYVDRNGEDKELNKTAQVNVAWFINKNIVANLDLVRCFKFKENGIDNVIITFKLVSGIEGGVAAEKEKSIGIDIPKISNISPQVLVSADRYTSEADLDVGILMLTKDVEKNQNNEYKWNQENDTIYVTYIYHNIGNDFYSNPEDVAFISSIKTVDNAQYSVDTQSGTITIPTEYNQEIKNEVLLNATSTSSINRGSIISNTATETTFDVKYTLNIGYPQLTDEIVLKENQNEYSSSYRTKSISVSDDDIERILGNNGKIKIKLNSETFEIQKNNNRTITVSEGDELKEVVIEGINASGNLNINIVKVTNGNAKTILAGKTEIVGGATVINTKGGDTNSTECQWETKIEEPTQKVRVESNFKTLSTINKNEDKVISVILESNTVDDYLFKSPSLRITYPESIKTISNVNIAVLYDEEELGSATTRINNDEHTLIVTFTGEQTKYAEAAVSGGILIRISADYTLDRLAPTKDSTIKIETYNVNTNEITTLQKGFRVVAPTQFIIQNKMDVTSPTNANGISDKNYFKESRETIEEDVEDIVIPIYSNEKYVDVHGTIVNNQGEDVNNSIIIGNFPSKNANSYSGTQFNGTFDTEVIGGIVLDNESRKTESNPTGTYELYYSKNANELVNSSNWTADFSEDVKSYKIVFLKTFKDTERKDFYYRVKVPADISYDQHVKESFALAYTTGAVAGEQYSYVESKPIGIATKPEADFSVDISLKDYITGTEIRNGDTVKEGEYLKVKVAITNTSNRKINNVKLAIELTKNLGEAVVDEDRLLFDEFGDDIEEVINEINASETKVVNKIIYVQAIRKIQEDEINLEDDNLDNDAIYSIMKFKIYEGNEIEFKPQEFKNKIQLERMSCITISPAEKKDVGVEDTFEQYFYIRNLTEDIMNNVEIKGTLPRGIDYNTEKNEKNNSENYEYSYNSDTREYTIKIKELKAYSFTPRIPLHLKASDYGTYILKTKATLNGEETSFNDITITVAGRARNFEVSHTISTQTNELIDTETFNFNIIIKNHWDSLKTVMFKDRLDDNFIVKEYTVLHNGEVKSQHKNTNMIEHNFKMEPEDVAEIRIKCGLKTQSKGSKINLTHMPGAKCDGVDIFINPITISVTGTGDFVNNNDPIINGKYSVSGTAWLDANNNGRREVTEQRIANITMKLLDNKTGKVYVDDDGKEKITTTSNNGEYNFTNIPVGSYVVVAYYDSEKYGCGDYQSRDAAEDMNNDFVETTFEGRIVGATDNIIIQNTSVYAIDISLIPRDTFDMAVDKKIASISVTTSTGKKANYKFDSELAKVEISNEKGVIYYLTIEYVLSVKNVGYIDGYVKNVIDYIPKGMTFVQEDNPGWYVKSDGYAYNTTLANTLIKAQNQVDLTIKLRKEVTAEQTGMIKNSVELGDVYNTQGVEDINSKGANKDSSENDYSEALVVIALSTGGNIIKVAGAIFGVLALGVVILSIAKIKRKKKII